MYKIWFFFIFFYSAAALADIHHVPSDSQDQGPDIPTVGSSLFDKIYSKPDEGGEPKYDIPYPLSKFVESMTDSSMDGDVVHAMFPFSRSLQRPQDYSYDPIENPRLVFAPRRDNASLTRAKIFFGFVKAKDQIEVISFNDEAGRYEYQIIIEYSSDPKVFYVDRGKCLSCHQGQAGIFSPPGWQDSTEGPMGNLIFEKFNIKGSKAQKKRRALSALFGPVKSNDQIAVFDSLVRRSNDISLDERVWVHGCGEDAKCRLGLLVNTLSRNSSQANPLIEYTRKVVRESELQKNQRYFSSFLTSTNIGVLDAVKKYGSIRAIISSPKAILEIISNLYNLEDADNPATKRPLLLSNKDLVKPMASFFNSDIAKLRKAIPSPNKVFEILMRLYEDKHRIFNSDAVNKLEIMKVILHEGGAEASDEYSYWLDKKTPEKVLFEGGFQPVFQEPVLNLFSRYCHQCHAVGFKFPPQFLLGSEEEVKEKIKGLKTRMIFKLSNDLMPPSKFERESMVDSGDYDKVFEYLKSL